MTAPEGSVAAGRIARAYYLIAGVYTLSASLIWGINTLFLLDAGLTLLQVFVANAVFTGSMALFEVPTGIVADTRGRRRSFLISVATLFAGTLAYVAIPAAGLGFPAFCAVSVVLGLGFTFYSGAVEAWLVDALHATGYAEPIDRVLARGSMIASAAMLVGSVSGGALGSLDLALPYLVRCLLLAVAFVLALRTMHDIGFAVRDLRPREMPAEMRRVGRESLRFGWRVPGVRLMILAAAVPAVFLEWGFHAWQPYFLGLLGSNAVWVSGMIAAAISLSTILGSWMVERLTRFCGLRTTLLLWGSAIYTVTAVGVGLVESFWAAVSLYLVGMMCTGLTGPVRQAYIHMAVPREQRATVLSLASLVASGGSASGQVGLGWFAARTSLSGGYAAGGAVTVLAIPLLLLVRRIGGPSDLIRGEAGRYTACSGLGVPEGVAVAAVRDVAPTSS